MRARSAWFACGLLLHAAACAQLDTNRPRSPYEPGYPKAITTRLMGSGLEDWVVVDSGMSRDVFVQTSVPKGQTIETSHDIVTRVNVVRLNINQKPEDLLQWSEKLTPRCQSYRRTESKASVQNNYPTATASFMCDGPHESGYGVVGVIHVIIRKPGSAGITQRLARVPPFDIASPPPEVYQKQQELGRWLDGLIFCDSADPKHPCPAGR